MKDICPDCHATVGELHHMGCDWETCPVCGGQLLSCRCAGRSVTRAGRIPFTGKRPDEIAAEEFGLYCYEDPKGYGKPEMNYGWIPCGKNHPKAIHDLNRVASELKWSSEDKKWVRADSKVVVAIGGKGGE